MPPMRPIVCTEEVSQVVTDCGRRRPLSRCSATRRGPPATANDGAVWEGLIAVRMLACLGAIAGGLVWVGRLVVGEEPAVLSWVGLALVTLALAAAGASLVTKGTWWLRLIVAVALPALVLSIYSGIRP